MTREDISKTFEGATDDQINAILNINSADIGKAKGKLDDITAQLSAAQDTIKELETNKADTTELQKVIDSYKEAETKRKAEEAAVRARAEITGRFDKALGDRKFAHEYIRNGVLADFEKALSDESNKGKSDVEIFDSLTKDEKGVKAGLFESQNKGGAMRGFGHVPNGDQAYLDDYYKNNPFYKP